MERNYAYDQIANSESLWDEYANTDGEFPFAETTYEQRKNLLRAAFGPEAA